MNSGWEEEAVMAASTTTQRLAFCISSQTSLQETLQNHCRGMPSSWEDPDHSIARNRASRTHIQDEPTFRQRIGSQHLQREKRHSALCELSHHSTARAHLENKASYLSDAQGTGTETPPDGKLT